MDENVRTGWPHAENVGFEDDVGYVLPKPPFRYAHNVCDREMALKSPLN